MDEKPKRIKGTLPPLAKLPPQQGVPAELPPFVGQNNSQQVQQAVLMGQSRGQAVRHVAHQTTDGESQNQGQTVMQAINETTPLVPGEFPPAQNLFSETNGSTNNQSDAISFPAASQTQLSFSAPSNEAAPTQLPNAIQNGLLSDALPNDVSGKSQLTFESTPQNMPVPNLTVPEPLPTQQPGQAPHLTLNQSTAGPAEQLTPNALNASNATSSQQSPQSLMAREIPPAFPVNPPTNSASTTNGAPQIASRSTPPLDARFDGHGIRSGETLPQTLMVSQSNQTVNASNASEGTGLPGPGSISGAQIPQLVIEKIVPAEVQINEPMTVRITVRNTGSAKARSVTVADRVPKGSRLHEVGSAGQSQNGDLHWEIGDLDVNEEKTVTMQIIPTTEGEIGSIATATFSFEATAVTRVTKPALAMEVKTVDSEHLVGGNIVFDIVISNPGTGVAKNISMTEYVPDGLSHAKGKELTSPIGDLQPSESKRLKLSLKCERAGEVANYLVAKTENGLMVESKMPVMVLAPDLSLAIDGPRVRYLERQATYGLQLNNPGTASARDIALLTQLPRGVDFVSTNSNGMYDPNTHTVRWALEELPAKQMGSIELTVVPKVAGDHRIEFSGKAANGLVASASHEVSVDGIAALGFEITKKNDPVELGRDATYEIRLYNTGTKAANNVSLKLLLSPEMRFATADGPTQYNVSESSVVFENLKQIAPKEEKYYTVTAKCLAVGDHRIKVQVQDDELSHPVTKEESTKVYGDE